MHIKPHIVVHVSGGNGSAIAYLRCVKRFGLDRVTGLFADTRTEDDDLYRFLDDIDRYIGKPMIRLDSGMNIWDCFDKTGGMKTAKGGCKASIELKQKPLDQWMGLNYTANNQMFGQRAVVAVGLSWMEPERQRRISSRLNYRVIFPLNWTPRLSACEEQKYLDDIGIKPARMYAMGYPHNNCGGGCVLAGQRQWAMLYKDWPERYEYCAKRESAFFNKTGFTALKDRRGGVTKSLTLMQFKERIERGEIDEGDFRSACQCMNPDPEAE